MSRIDDVGERRLIVLTTEVGMKSEFEDALDQVRKWYFHAAQDADAIIPVLREAGERIDGVILVDVFVLVKIGRDGVFSANTKPVVSREPASVVESLLGSDLEGGVIENEQIGGNLVQIATHRQDALIA